MANLEINEDLYFLDEFGKDLKDLKKNIEKWNKKDEEKFGEIKDKLDKNIVEFFNIDNLTSSQKKNLIKIKDNMKSIWSLSKLLEDMKDKWLANNKLVLILNDFENQKDKETYPIKKIFTNMDEKWIEKNKEDKIKEFKKILSRWVLLEFKPQNSDIKIDFKNLDKPDNLIKFISVVESWEFNYKWIVWAKEKNWKVWNNYEWLWVKWTVKEFIKDIKENYRLSKNLMNGCIPGE